MVRKSQRPPNKTQRTISVIKKNGEFYNSLYFTCYFEFYEERQIIFSINRKVGKAVLRNKLKRIIRFYIYNSKITMRYFIIVKRIENYHLKVLHQSMKNFFHRIHCLQKLKV